jgi:hypothetical protein
VRCHQHTITVASSDQFFFKEIPLIRQEEAMGDVVRPIDQAIYDSGSPRVAVWRTRYGHGFCTVLWIKASDQGWVLLPHGMPDLAVHLATNELVTMLNRLRGKL